MTEREYRCGCGGSTHEMFCFVAWQQMADARRGADVGRVRPWKRVAVVETPKGQAKICRNCEYYDDGTGEPRTAKSGDCLNSYAPRFQTKPNETCPHWHRST